MQTKLNIQRAPKGWRRLRLGETIRPGDRARNKDSVFDGKPGCGIDTMCAGYKVTQADCNYYYRHTATTAGTKLAK